MAKTKTKGYAPYGMESALENVPGYGMIQFCIVDNYEPAKLPWYRDANAIPAEMIVEAEKVAREKAADENEFEWLMRNWRCVVTGWSNAVRMYCPWFMYSPTKALEWMSGLCMHAWGERTPHVAHANNVLGTYDTGYVHHCTKCGEQEYVTTAFNNYSGD